MLLSSLIKILLLILKLKFCHSFHCFSLFFIVFHCFFFSQLLLKASLLVALIKKKKKRDGWRHHMIWWNWGIESFAFARLEFVWETNHRFSNILSQKERKRERERERAKPSITISWNIFGRFSFFVWETKPLFKLQYFVLFFFFFDWLI